MAAKRKGSSAGSKGRGEAKKALAGMEKGHKMLQLNLKKLKAVLGVDFTGLGHTFVSGRGNTFAHKGHTFTK